MTHPPTDRTPEEDQRIAAFTARCRPVRDDSGLMPAEPEITVNGTRLSTAEAMTLHVAMATAPNGPALEVEPLIEIDGRHLSPAEASEATAHLASFVQQTCGEGLGDDAVRKSIADGYVRHGTKVLALIALGRFETDAACDEFLRHADEDAEVDHFEALAVLSDGDER